MIGLVLHITVNILEIFRLSFFKKIIIRGQISYFNYSRPSITFYKWREKKNICNALIMKKKYACKFFLMILFSFTTYLKKYS